MRVRTAGRVVTRWARYVFAPPAALRAAAVVVALIVLVNLFFHGAQPYAVNAVPAPWDKGVHAVLHAGLATLMWVALAGRTPLRVLLLCAAIAAADEAAQVFEPGRQVDAGDWLAGVFGALMAVAALRGLGLALGYRP